jgi:hypothetical protein
MPIEHAGIHRHACQNGSRPCGLMKKASMRDHRQGEARSIAADYSGRGPQGVYGEAGGVTRDLRQDGLVLLGDSANVRRSSSRSAAESFPAWSCFCACAPIPLLSGRAATQVCEVVGVKNS